ncbi:MAG: hypothetical protein ACRENL_02785 [Candidatus Dormibacteria bacterium]
MSRGKDAETDANQRCWVVGCRACQTSGSTLLQLAPRMSLYVVLCVAHEQLLREHVRQPLVEALPAMVAADRRRHAA